MANKRKSYTPAQNIALVTQVDGVCPLCNGSLFYMKNGSSYKDYEIAHIYPLNPTEDEEELLKNEERLSNDVNHEDNVISLCKGCHGKYDKPRTVKEYRQLAEIKKQLIKRSNQQDIWKQYQIEEDIGFIIEALYSEESPDLNIEIKYSSKEVDRKLDNTITNLTKRKIKDNVSGYFVFIREKFALMDQISPDLSDLISTQIKSYYKKQKNLNLTQQEIFDNIVSWIIAKTKPKTNDAAEILTSFFIQNCEVFE